MELYMLIGIAFGMLLAFAALLSMVLDFNTSDEEVQDWHPYHVAEQSTPPCPQCGYKHGDVPHHPV
jgi:hypothetical protein